MGDEETSGKFWRARANRLKRLTRGVRSKSVERDAREDEDGKDDDGDVSPASTGTRDGDADVDAAAWALTTSETARVDARPSMWTPRPCPTTMETSTSGSRWSESRGRRRRDADGAAGDALDDARSLDSLRAGYKTLLREVTARHARVREDMEREIASLRDRVRELETAADARDGGAARRRSPRREVLAPRSPGDDAVECELSPMSAADRTPPPMPRETSPESARADEKENEDASSTPKAFRPPRPPSREGSDADDSWIEAWERAEFSRGALPLNVRPGKGFVCPFTGAVVNRTP